MTKKAEEKLGYGGNRPGAGRKPMPREKRKIAYAFSLHYEVMEKIEALARKEDISRSAALEKIVRQF